MKSVDVIARIGLGEESRTRFLPNVTDEDTLAQELVSLANGRGGCVYLGVDDRGSVLALSTMNRAQARRAIHANKYIDTEDFSNPMPVSGFNAMKALSTRNGEPEKASRPFDKDREGFVMGEGAGILILEELTRALDRGAKIYAEIAGYGLTGDAYHITAPAPDGDGATRCMAMALRGGNIAPHEVDYRPRDLHPDE